MKLLDSFTVTTIADCTAPEVVPTAYDAGTTYAAGAVRSVAGALGLHTVYESLQNGNLGNTPSSSPLWWREKGVVYGAYSSGHADGEVVTDTTNHRLYESLTGANSNPLPAEDSDGNPTSDANWLFLGPSNRWAPFDEKNGTVVTWDQELAYEIDVTGRINAIQFLGLTGASLNVTMIGEGAVEVYNVDHSLIDLTGVIDEWSWCFLPNRFVTDLAVEDLPLDIDPTLTMTLTGDDDVTFGTINIGFAHDIGETLRGARAGNRTFSVIAEDDFGVTSITRRDTVKRMVLRVRALSEDTDFVFNLLDSYDARPVGIIGASLYGSLNQYGLIRSWEEAIEDQGPDHTAITLEFESL